MKRLHVAAIFLSSYLLTSSAIHAAFTKVGEIALSRDTPNGLAFDGTQWHVSEGFFPHFHTYDASFNFLTTTPVPGFRDLRGLTYDPNSAYLFVGDQRSSGSVVRELTVDGTTVQQFVVPSSALNALAYDPQTDTIWLGLYDSGIEHRTRTGALLGSFSTLGPTTGLAIDTSNHSLLVLADDDTLHEYAFDGTLIGHPLSTDVIPFNGLGLAYDPSLGRLWVTTQETRLVTVFDDPSRVVPEPSTFLMATTSLVVLCLVAKRSRRLN